MLEFNLFIFQKTFKKIIILFKIFDKYSKSYKVNYCDIRFIFDDFKIINFLIKDKFYIKNKIYYYKIKKTQKSSFFYYNIYNFFLRLLIKQCSFEKCNKIIYIHILYSI